MDRVDLQHARYVRDLIAHFSRRSMKDEEALRNGIELGLSDLNDHVARLEEHAEH